MKHLAPYAMLLLLSFSFTTGFSQNGNAPKPKQFSNFPDIINCSEAELSSIFNSSPGQNISLSFSNNFLFSGNVTSNVVKYANLQTAVVKSPVFNNTIFSVSKIINKDNSISYLGRIINKNYFDGYELKRNTAGNYQLIKMETDRVIQDCRQL
ncbi:MAG: hypothetical protein ABI666_07535 [Ferruginibacter sp.]